MSAVCRRVLSATACSPWLPLFGHVARRTFSASSRRVDGNHRPGSAETLWSEYWHHQSEKNEHDHSELSQDNLHPQEENHAGIQYNHDIIREFSPLLLRDLCDCPACIDPSTKQKLFSTADIPATINHASIDIDREHVHIRWVDDIPGYDVEHTTSLKQSVLDDILWKGNSHPTEFQYWPPERVLWWRWDYSQLQDIDYEAYMQDDGVLFRALEQLTTHGLMFLTGVPESEKSVSTIGERIGPLKNTFYGYTWDVRSVPKAKNVAYTSQDLGFHMDLLYMHQPPHIQLLHCIRSSSSGGASLFTDSFKSAVDMWYHEPDHFASLSNLHVNFHYHHPASHLYAQDWPVFDIKSRGNALDKAATLPHKQVAILKYLRNINWSPPFQAPFRLGDRFRGQDGHLQLRKRLEKWHSAAAYFNSLIHRPQGIYERLMKPGECVIFDNRRVLHARRAFDVGDVGKERWLRGAYLDRDPFESKMRVLAAALQR